MSFLALVACLVCFSSQDDPTAALAQARRADAAGDGETAERFATKAMEADSDLAEAYYLRGRARFLLNRMPEALADFDAYVKRRPQAASRQWERGITCYYAGKFAEGAAQFRLYQTYHDNDVENSVWRFLCMARSEGPAAARKAMLPIRNDPRVPMMEIFRMFAGQSKPADVLRAVEKGKPNGAQRAGRLFYARLYIGLYWEALGNEKQATEFLRLAATQHSRNDPINGFMWSVADVHYRTLKAAEKKTPKR